MADWISTMRLGQMQFGSVQEQDLPMRRLAQSFYRDLSLRLSLCDVGGVI
jgi:hypothetical protein